MEKLFIFQINIHFLCEIIQFIAKHIAPESIDGAADANKDIRNKLWDISHKRAVYPQLFVRPASEGTASSSSDVTHWKFLGDWTSIKELNEDNDSSKALDNLLNDIVRKH